MINGTILQKLQVLDETLLELRSLGHITHRQLRADWRTRRAVERDLQILVKVVIDICQRLIAVTNQTPATSSVEAVQRCIEMGVLSDYEPYWQMVQFRNFIVHRYEKIDLTILVEVVNQRLEDFERFKAEVLAYAQD